MSSDHRVETSLPFPASSLSALISLNCGAFLARRLLPLLASTSLPLLLLPLEPWLLTRQTQVIHAMNKSVSKIAATATPAFSAIDQLSPLGAMTTVTSLAAADPVIDGGAVCNAVTVQRVSWPAISTASKAVTTRIGSGLGLIPWEGTAKGTVV